MTPTVIVCIASIAIRKPGVSWTQCLTPVMLATWEPEIGRIVVQTQPRQIVSKTAITKITRAK
jgi:hypothetical protein